MDKMLLLILSAEKRPGGNVMITIFGNSRQFSAEKLASFDRQFYASLFVKSPIPSALPQWVGSILWNSVFRTEGYFSRK
jgi:hypothetical protein